MDTHPQDPKAKMDGLAPSGSSQHQGPMDSSRGRRPLPAGSFSEGVSFPAAAACIVLVALFLRPGIVAVGPLLTVIRDRFALSHAEASLLTTIPDLLMGILALPTPWLAHRFGRDRTILAALILLFAAIAARAFVPSRLLLLLTTIGVGAGIAVAGALIAGFIKATYPTKAVVLMGIYASSLSIGSTVAAGVTGPIANALGGWRFGIGIWAALGITAIAAWLYIEWRSPRAAFMAVHARRYSLPVGHPTAWLVALFFAFDNFLFYADLSWIATIYRERGYGETESGLILACFTGGLIFSTPLAGALSKNTDRRLHLALWAVLTLLGLIPFAVDPTAWPFLSVSLISLGIGGGFTLGMTLPLDNTREHAETTAWNAFTLTVGYIVAAAGPFAVGAIRDITGSFAGAMWMLVGVGVLMLLLTPFLKPHIAEHH